MEMNDFRIINAPRDRVWVALNDPGILRQCIIGCDSLERQDDGSLDASMSVRVGPVSAKFKGKVRLQDVKAPESYTLMFEGNGGAAGFAKGSATVALTPEGGKTRLSYSATSQIGGKLAQVGSRLIDAAAKKIAEDFFTKFGELVGAPDAPADGEHSSAASATGTTAPMAAGKPGSLKYWVLAAIAIAVVIVIWARR